MRVLYICTENRCRSIICEAMTRQLAGALLVAESAGSHPHGEVHPMALQSLQSRGINTEGLHSKSWEGLEAFKPDLVITVCNSAAGEACPLWFGEAINIRWELVDPSKLTGSDQDRQDAFWHCMDIVEQRIQQLKLLADQNLSTEDLKHGVQQLAYALD